MNNLEQERQIIENILNDYLDFLRTYSHFKSKLIIDEAGNSYLIILYGLLNNDQEQFHDFIIHLEIIDRKIHIIHDYADIGNKLSNAGISNRSLLWHGYPKSLKIDFAISLEKIHEQHQSIFAVNTDPKQPKIKLDATPEELIELSNIETRYIGSEIASHPNISIDLLLKLFPRFPAEVFANPRFSKIMDPKSDFLRSLYNAFPNIFFEVNDLVLPDFFIEWALAQKDLHAYVCGSHKLPIKYLERLIDDENCRIFANMMCRLGRQNSCANRPGNYPVPPELDQKIVARYSYFQSICPEKDWYNLCRGICGEIISSM